MECLTEMDDQPVIVNPHLLPPDLPTVVIVPPEAEAQAAQELANQGAENGNDNV